jgi:hypothetical protein
VWHVRAKHPNSIAGLEVSTAEIKKKNQILPFVLYVCETQYLTTRKEHRLRAFKEQGAEENIWTQERGSGGRLEKSA